MCESQFWRNGNAGRHGTAGRQVANPDLASGQAGRLGPDGRLRHDRRGSQREADAERGGDEAAAVTLAAGNTLPKSGFLLSVVILLLSRTLQQHDVVLLLMVAGLGVQRNGPLDEVGEHRQRLRFLVEEEIDDGRCGEHAHLARLELTRLA